MTGRCVGELGECGKPRPRDCLAVSWCRLQRCKRPVIRFRPLQALYVCPCHRKPHRAAASAGRRGGKSGEVVGWSLWWSGLGLARVARTLALLTTFRGAKRGTNDHSYMATPGHAQPLWRQPNGTSGHIRPCIAAFRECLLSSRQRGLIKRYVQKFLATASAGRSGP
jgi:hypothetical protein